MKILNLLLLVLISSQFSITAQNLDSLYYSFIEMHSYSGKFNNLPKIDRFEESGKAKKCGYSLVSEVKRNFDNFSTIQKNIMQPMFSRLELDVSFVTPGGFFRIHHDTSGINTPGYDLNLLAQALDSTYKFEITELGYTVPPSDGIEGGDNKYDIYLVNTIYYGFTTPETPIGNNKSTSFITIDNDFSSGFATLGIDGARVTVAHEFHHAIQLGGYSADPQGDEFYYEITSTAFEEFVFDDVNDYYAYTESYFDNPERTFGRFSSGNDGYDLAIWNIFLQKKYGFGILKKIWELKADGQRAVRAIDNALAEEGSSFKQEMNEFGEWTYFTGHRASITLPYFEEAKFYPLIVPMLKVLYLPPSDNVTINSNAASNNFLQFVDESQGRSDTLVAIVTNADIIGSFESSNPAITNFNFELASDAVEGMIKVADNYFYNTALSTSNQLLFAQNIILNNIANKIIQPSGFEYPYPQPFNYSEHSKIDIPTSTNDEEDEAELYIFSSNMELIFSDKQEVFISRLNAPAVSWNGKDNEGDKVASGIYLYVTKRGSEIKKGKLAIFND